MATAAQITANQINATKSTGPKLSGVLPNEPDQRIARKLINGSDRALANLQRYASAAERSYYKAHAELLKARAQNEPKSAQPKAAAVS